MRLAKDVRVYGTLLADIKSRIQSAQTRAILAVNAELIRLYWDIGRLLDARQAQEGWGAAVIPRLGADIRNELPEVKGFSERNMKRMLAFFREYSAARPALCHRQWHKHQRRRPARLARQKCHKPWHKLGMPSMRPH
jgi:hypothetical protein